MDTEIYNQNGKYIKTLHPSTVVRAHIYNEDERRQINELIKANYLPHHSAVGTGRSTGKHWSLENYKGKFGEGFKLITTSPYSTNFNHITYFIKQAS